MLCILAVLAAAVWLAFKETSANSGNDFGGPVDITWVRVLYLSQTANIGLAAAIAIGIAVAAALDSAVSRAAATLGIVAGLWFVAAGFMGIAYVIHDHGAHAAFLRANGPYTVQSVAVAVLGVLLAMAAWRIATSVPLEDFDDDADAEEEDLETVS